MADEAGPEPPDEQPSEVQLVDAREQARRRKSAATAPAAHPLPAPAVSSPERSEEAFSPLPRDHDDPAALVIEMVELHSEPADSNGAGQGGSAANASLGSSGTEEASSERVVLNLFVSDDSQELQRELQGMRAAFGVLQAQLAEAQAALAVARAQAEASGSAAARLEAAREQGQLRGRIAKLEGSVLAGECRVKAQAAEVEALRAANARLERQLADARAAAAVTPDRTRLQKENLEASLQEVQAAVDQKAARLAALQQVVSFDSRERSALHDFSALEYTLLSEAEQSLMRDVQRAEAATAAAAEEAAAASRRAEAAEVALAAVQRDLHAACEAAAAAREAAGAAEQQAAEWRSRAGEVDQDRQQAAANLRKAEREVDLIAQENECIFRQLNYTRTRLVAHLAPLEVAAPELGKLTRELSAWVEREQAQRTRAGLRADAAAHPAR